MSKIVGVTVGTPISLSRINREITPKIQEHEDNKKNPHGVTKDQIGLGKVDNTSDIDKPVSTAQADAILTEANKVRAEKAETKTYHGLFPVSGWNDSAPFTQSITVEGVLSTDYPFVDIDLSDVEDATKVIEGWAMVGRCTVSADNTVIAYCYEDKPEVDIPIIFKVVR